MSTKLTGLMVGMIFRAPAKQVLAVLLPGTPLVLVPEPENPYDEGAIKVLVDPKAIPGQFHGELESALVGTGWTLEDLLTGGLVWLGYIGKTGGAPLAKAEAKLGYSLAGNTEWVGVDAAALGWSGAGDPLVVSP